jgi:hypothetical protein
MAHFTEDAWYAGPSVLDDAIRLALADGDSLLKVVGHAARSGDDLELVGVLGFVKGDHGWRLEPAITEIVATLRTGARVKARPS